MQFLVFHDNSQQTSIEGVNCKMDQTEGKGNQNKGKWIKMR